MARDIQQIFSNVEQPDYTQFVKVSIWLNDEWRLPVMFNRDAIKALIPELDQKNRLTGYTTMQIDFEPYQVHIANSEADRIAKWLCK